MPSVTWKIPLVTLCIINFGDNVTIQPNFEAEKYTGTWYTIAVLMDLGGLMNSNSHLLRVELLEKGNLVVHITKPEENCKTQKTWLTKSSQPGVFKTKHSIIYILETDYDSYAILYVETPHQKILHLNARAPEASDEARGRFNHLAATLGLTIDKTIYLTKAASCLVMAQRRRKSPKLMSRKE